MQFNIDAFFLEMFGDFAIHARMILTFWVIFALFYFLVRIPRGSRKTAEDRQMQSKLLLVFAGFAALIPAAVVVVYLLSK